jgi:hypothetical protein
MQSKDWIHPLKSTWFVLTSETESELNKRLLRHLGQRDRLVITEVSGLPGGWLPAKYGAWFKDNIRKRNTV